jgi:hypothetical protein
MGNTLTLSGNTFVVPLLPAMRSFLLQPKIAPAVGAVFGALAPLAKGDMGGADVEALAPLLGGFFAKLGPADLEEVVRTLLDGATMDGTPLFSAAGDTFNLRMQGRTLDTWKLLAFAVKVNYPDFFGLLGGSQPPSEGVKKA